MEFAELGGAHSRIFPEEICKVEGVGVAAKLRDLRDGIVGVVEKKLLRVAKALNTYVVGGCCSKLLFEFPYQPRMAEVDSGGKLVDIKVLVKMLVDIIYCAGYLLADWEELGLFCSSEEIIFGKYMLDDMGDKLTVVGQDNSSCQALQYGLRAFGGQEKPSAADRAVKGLRLCLRG